MHTSFALPGEREHLVRCGQHPAGQPRLKSSWRQDAAKHGLEARAPRINLNPQMNLPIPILSVLIGVVLLLFGRRLFWLLVAAVGFAAGVELAPSLVHEPSQLLVITAALVLGFIGALLALFLQKFAIAVVGFVAGGRLAVAIMAAFVGQHETTFALTFIIGGIVGGLLFLFLFDWALIFLSSTVGAYMILSAVTLPQAGAAIAFVVITLVGVLVQAGFNRRARTT